MTGGEKRAVARKAAWMLRIRSAHDETSPPDAYPAFKAKVALAAIKGEKTQGLCHAAPPCKWPPLSGGPLIRTGALLS